MGDFAGFQNLKNGRNPFPPQQPGGRPQMPARGGAPNDGQAGGTAVRPIPPPQPPIPVTPMPQPGPIYPPPQPPPERPPMDELTPVMGEPTKFPGASPLPTNGVGMPMYVPPDELTFQPPAPPADGAFSPKAGPGIHGGPSSLGNGTSPKAEIGPPTYPTPPAPPATPSVSFFQPPPQAPKPPSGMTTMTDETNRRRSIGAPRIPPMKGGNPGWYGKNAPQGKPFTPPPSAGLMGGQDELNRKKKSMFPST